MLEATVSPSPVLHGRPQTLRFHGQREAAGASQQDFSVYRRGRSSSGLRKHRGHMLSFESDGGRGDRL